MAGSNEVVFAFDYVLFGENFAHVFWYRIGVLRFLFLPNGIIKDSDYY